MIKKVDDIIKAWDLALTHSIGFKDYERITDLEKEKNNLNKLLHELEEQKKHFLDVIIIKEKEIKKLNLDIKELESKIEQIDKEKNKIVKQMEYSEYEKYSFLLI